MVSDQNQMTFYLQENQLVEKICMWGGKRKIKVDLKGKKKKNPNEQMITITHLESDLLKSEVKWALGSITTNKVSRGDGIPAELFQILKDDAVKVLHSIHQQILKT